MYARAIFRMITYVLLLLLERHFSQASCVARGGPQPGRKPVGGFNVDISKAPPTLLQAAVPLVFSFEYAR